MLSFVRVPLCLLAVILCSSAAFAGSSSINITSPMINANDPTNTAMVAVANALNSKIAESILSTQTKLNDDYFSKFHDQTELARGFANANSVSTNNASMMGYQNYDLFCVMIGSNLGFAYPSLSASETAQAFRDVKNKGDVYTGIGTGGFAGQVGINAGFILENLYLSAKFGMYTYSQKFGNTEIKLDQKMFGIGANYNIVSSWDFLYGLAKWRGVSLGAGLVYNSSSSSVSMTFSDQPIEGSVDVGSTTWNYTGSVSNINAKLSIDSTSIVLPLEAVTSVQFLWLFNLGVGAGVDVIIPSSTIKLGGGANAIVNSPDSSKFTPSAGSVEITGSNTSNKPKFFDVISPRLSTDIGFNVSVVKFDITGNWYPISKAASIGAAAGVAW